MFKAHRILAKKLAWLRVSYSSLALQGVPFSRFRSLILPPLIAHKILDTKTQQHCVYALYTNEPFENQKLFERILFCHASTTIQAPNGLNIYVVDPFHS